MAKNIRYSKEQKEYLLSILHKSGDEIRKLMEEKFGITEITNRKITDYRRYYKIKCQEHPLRRKQGEEWKDFDGYVMLKTKDGPVKKHRYLWEKEYGKIPDNHFLIFLDKNRENVSLDNLMLVSRKTLFRASTSKLITDNKELTKAGIYIAQLINKRRQIARENGIKIKKQKYKTT